MQIYRINKETDEWLKKAYDYVRTDAFCFGQNIPVELEFAGEEAQDDLEGVVILEDHKPVAGCRISYPADGIGKIERVCVVHEKQKGGYGSMLMREAEKWLIENGVRHIVINSQDRAAGFYHKLGYITNPTVDPHAYDKKRKRKKAADEASLPKINLGFSTVLVEKYV